MPQGKNTISKVNIYKLNTSFNAPSDEYKLIHSGEQSRWNFNVFVKSSGPKIPTWYPLIKSFIDDEKIGRNIYNSLIIIFQKDDLRYALTAGYGYTDVRGYSVPDFGINIAVRSINPNEIKRLIQKSPVGNVYGYNRLLRGKYIPESDDINKKSVLKSLEGKVIDEELGTLLSGAKSLSVSGSKNFDEIIELLNKIIEIEKIDEPLIKIEGLNEVSKETGETLDKELFKKIKEGDIDDALLGYEDDLILANCEKISFDKNNKSFLISEVQKIIREAIKLNPQNPEEVRISGLDENDQDIFKNTKLFDLLEGEVQYQNDAYFRMYKIWYKTSQDYIRNIDNDFKGIKKESPDYLARWETSKGTPIIEDEYLKKNASKEKILTHRKKISGQIEFADMFDRKNNYIIHIKKGRGAFLRNLFAQGYVSASLFFSNQKFQKEVQDKFSIDLKNPSDYTIVFAIFDPSENTDSTFSLFAKVDFLERHDSLRKFGYNVKYCLISSENK